MKKQSGFSLLELLIVLAVIGILAALSVPHLLRSKAAANEGAALASVRTLMTAQMTYASTAGGGFYGSLAELQSTGLIDNVLGSGSKDGYNYTLTGDDTSISYTVTAVPVQYPTTGTRGFFGDSTGVLRYAPNGAAPTAASTPIGG